MSKKWYVVHAYSGFEKSVQRALTERIRRMSRLRDRTQESILEQVALVDTAGSHVGQVNGLSVIELGGYSFGRPPARRSRGGETRRARLRIDPISAHDVCGYFGRSLC